MIHNTETATESVDTGALVIDGPQPVWMTLNDAREQAFTGEITFEGDPEVLAYLDNGVVYFAERVGDAPLGQRLLDAGVLDATQLERGLVRLGDLEHLGRLFDRDPSINRDAVVVTAELFTEELISDIANRTIADAHVVAYRHHPSGLHRWFVAPIDQPVVARPIGAIGQLDGTVVDDLPSLPYVLDDDELMIEWDAMVDAELDIDDVEAMDESEIQTGEITEVITPEEFDADALELSLELAEFVDDADEQVDPPDFELVDVDFDDADAETVDHDTVDTETVDTETVDDLVEDLDDLDDLDDDVEVPALQMPELEFDDDALVVDHADADTDGEADGDDFEFSVVWPDGSEQLADGAAADLDDSLDVEPTFTETDDGELQFSMPPLTLSDEPEMADAEVPDDVADAVRRAIAAIESASVGEVDVDVDLGDVVPETADVEISHVEISHVEITDVDATAMEITEVEITEVEITAMEITEVETDLAGVDEIVEAPAGAGAGKRPRRIRSADDGNAGGSALRPDVRRWRCCRRARVGSHIGRPDTGDGDIRRRHRRPGRRTQLSAASSDRQPSSQGPLIHERRRVQRSPLAIARRSRKNVRSSSAASSASTPPVTSTRWLSTSPSSRPKWLVTAPAFGSSVPYTRRPSRALTAAPAHIAHGSKVT